MGYLLSLLVAMGSLALPRAFAEPLAQPWIDAAPLVFVLPHLVARLARRSAARGRTNVTALLERALVGLPMAIQLAFVGLFDWIGALERWTGIDVGFREWPGLEVLLGIAPFLLATTLAIDARARLHHWPLAGARVVRRFDGVEVGDPYADGVRRARAFQFRLLASTLAPLVLYLCLSGLVATRESLRVRLEEVDLLAAGFTVLLLAVFVLFLPRMLTSAWDTVPLERGKLRDLLESLARRAGFRCRDLLVWRTGAQMANAAIVGFTPRSRVVLFSDVLLAKLSFPEIAAVFGHEMGHARRWHAAIFAAYTLSVLLAVELIAYWFVPAVGWIALALLAVGFVLWAYSFSFLSRRFELEADLESLELMGASEPLVTALEQVTGAHAYSRSSWRHFSTEERVRFLRAVEADPSLGRALRTKLSRWSRAGFVFFALTLALHVHQLSRGWNEGQLVAELRLGLYDQAADRYRALPAGFELEEPRIAELIRVARDVEPDARSGAALDARARRRFEAGDDARALDLLELSYLRGDGTAGWILDALDARSAGGSNERAEAELPDAWLDAFAARFGAGGRE